MSNGKPISVEELILPAFHITAATRLIRDRSRLQYMRGCALGDYPDPQYFWDCEDRWYQAVDIVRLGKASFWMRLRGPSDLMIATYKLMPIEKPLTKTFLFREFSAIAGGALLFKGRNRLERKQLKKEARALLKKCTNAREVMDWYEKIVVDERMVY